MKVGIQIVMRALLLEMAGTEIGSELNSVHSMNSLPELELTSF